MAQDVKREPPVRLPNPSAQPFVAALKTARFYTVIFFWVTMVCVLAYVAAFVLAEWANLYDMPAAEPAKAAPTKTSPAKAAPAGPVSWLGIFESTAAAAEPESKGGASFFGLEAAKKKAVRPETPQEPAAGPATKAAEPATPESATEGKIIAERPTLVPRASLTPDQQRRRAQYYHDLTVAVLPPLRIVGFLASILLGATLFVYLQITLLGRLAGIRHLTNAVFLLMVFWVTVMPWENVFPGFRVSAFYDFSQLLEAHASRLAGAAGNPWDTALYFGRFCVLPLVSLLLLACSGIRFAAGYHESVVANE